ncbi:glycoside hydrolase family 105 protein [Polychaeton citri CBS 116435]|uniref:Glycoside hydrolase family 105 protein n=1 Tax=Polychaeton citri CBS 116435 TaxID=1314669 RepID=A0A9P4ULT1_9PEZI|nr:glycoside hydrolase family 105 protein [Polychaeton citri CBS 116435]
MELCRRKRSADIHGKIELLISNLVNTQHTKGEFLLRLNDGRIIDTKNEKTNDQTCLLWLDTWAKWAIYDLERIPCGRMQYVTYTVQHDRQLWDDTLTMMTVLPLANIGRLLGRLHYAEEDSSLFSGNLTVIMTAIAGSPSSHWIAQSSGASPENALKSHLVDTIEAQYPDGMRRTLLDVPEVDGSQLGASAAVGFAYGNLESIPKQHIGKERDGSTAQAAGAAVEQANPTVSSTGKDLQHYLATPLTSVPYGQQ